MASERRGVVALVGLFVLVGLFTHVGPFVLVPAPASLGAQEVPTPESHFGHQPGEDRSLASWTELTSYYEALARTSPRVRVDTLGLTTRGRPFVLLTMTSEENQQRLDELREIQLRLADPRTIQGPEEEERLLEAGRAVVLMTHGIHASEVGTVEVVPLLAYRLATSEEPEILEILDEVVILDVPSLNPDGTDWVAEWYEQWLGTDYEGSPYPGLYHHYVGHDANRDWYAFTQVETRLTVTGVHNRWRPHVVHDLHQMGRTGPRMFVPPYVDPWEPNVDPALVTAVNDLGTAVAARLQREEKAGVAVSAIYDAFSPSRAYQHYHAGARILTETASARLASPDTVFAWQLRPDRGFEPDRSTWNHPDPWTGGRWGLPEITDYMQSAAMAVLEHAARNRRQWLETSLGVNRRAVEGWEERPVAWILPADGGGEGLPHLLRVLRMGDVEVFRAAEAIEIPGRPAPAGSYVIPMRQPYAGFAQALLQPMEYPDIRRYPGGPPIPPYDATAHTLPLLMGVEAVPVEAMPDVDLEPFTDMPQGSFLPPSELVGPTSPRIALYAPHQESRDTGWTRWLFDRHGISYRAVSNEEVAAGSLAERYDVIVLQNQSRASIVNGWSERTMPPAWAGGMGVAGTRAIRDFVRNGGRLVAVEAAVDFAAQALGLSVTNAVERLPDQEFFVPGSIIRLAEELPVSRRTGEPREGPIPDPRDADRTVVDSSGGGIDDQAPGPFPRETAVWYGRDSRVFNVTDPSVRVLARYGQSAPLLSGWLVGAEHLAGRPALLEATVGRGSVVLFGFQPNYRGQSVATWPLLFDTLVWRAGDVDAGR